MTDTDTIDPAYVALTAPLDAVLLPFDANRIDAVRASRNAVMGQVAGRRADEVTREQDGDCTIFTPANATPGTVLYIHGGGWVLCDVQTHSAIMTDLAATSGMRVVGVDYPLAPEHPYPAALDMLRKCAADHAGDGPLVLAGDSAGANLALGLAARLRAEHGPRVDALVLFYGCYRHLFDTESHLRNGDGRYGLTTDGMRTYWRMYLGDAANPAFGDLTGLDMAGLPPAFIGDAALDCLLDDGVWLAEGFRQAGIPHRRQVVPRVPHGFLHQTGRYDPAYAVLDAAGQWLKAQKLRA